MKKLFISILLINSVLNIFSQTNGKYFADTCYWYVYDWNYNGNPIFNPPSYRHEYQKVEGDTIYNGLIHQKIYRKTYSTVQQINPADLNFYGYYLHDSGKVYSGSALSNLKLTYNFNLMPGDSFMFNGYTGTLNTPSNFYVKVNIVDSIFLGNKWRKRIVFFSTNYVGSPPYQNVVISWVEGIGDPSFGPIHSLESIQTLKGIGDIDLMCFTENFNQVIGTCNFIGIEELNMAENELLLSPQPANDIIYIQSTHVSFKESEPPVLYDLKGRKVSPSWQYINANTYKLDVTNLDPGMYLLAVESNKRKVKKKIIIQH